MPGEPLRPLLARLEAMRVQFRAVGFGSHPTSEDTRARCFYECAGCPNVTCGVTSL